ncbi:MAG TPA: polyhydroxyalkanoate synthesis regulator DNA-binding domain-containing protein [Terracidiphilus sp.]|nr:polyhydroxyalkanoate synthesis regulator DNA-binding domain-containing protein [Terracidiphilus sp.]
MAQRVVVIKKYENRRLYDTTNSRYVNLEEVAQLLQRGDDVRVVDAATGEDITRLILTQIIVEDAKTPESNFPLDVLRQMVIATGRASQESALKYMKAMLDIYQNTYRAMTPSVNPFDLMQGFAASRAPAPGAAPPEATEAPRNSRSQAAKPPRTQASEEVTQLQQRVAELEKLVGSLAGKKTARKK